MNTPDISQAKDPDMRASLNALRKASQMARETAIRTNTNIVIVKNGQLVRIPGNQLHKQEAQSP